MDRELEAITSVLSLLKPFSIEARYRILNYVSSRTEEKLYGDEDSSSSLEV